MRELYLYYRVDPAAALQAGDEVRALQVELCERMPGLVARWLLRAETTEAASLTHQTWMEIYTHPAGLSDDAMAVILSRGDEVVRSIAGPRHPEVFSPCA